MKFHEWFAILCWIHAVASLPFRPVLQSKRDVDPALVPPFGWKAGINPDGTGNCDGAVNGTNGKPILIPCQCPPNSTFFLSALNKNVAAGFVTTNPTVKLTFPVDNSTDSQLARLNAAAVTLQNLEGPGIGCPISSTTFTARHKAIAAEPSSVAPPATAPTATLSTPATPSASLSASQGTGIGSCAARAAGTPRHNINATTVTPSLRNTTIQTDAQIAAIALEQHGRDVHFDE